MQIQYEISYNLSENDKRRQSRIGLDTARSHESFAAKLYKLQ